MIELKTIVVCVAMSCAAYEPETPRFFPTVKECHAAGTAAGRTIAHGNGAPAGTPWMAEVVCIVEGRAA